MSPNDYYRYRCEGALVTGEFDPIGNYFLMAIFLKLVGARVIIDDNFEDPATMVLAIETYMHHEYLT